MAEPHKLTMSKEYIHLVHISPQLVLFERIFRHILYFQLPILIDKKNIMPVSHVYSSYV